MVNKITGIVKACTDSKEFQGILQIGFLLNDSWYNITGEREQLEATKKLVAKGNEIEFDFDPEKKAVSNLIVLKVAEKKESWQDDIIDFETLMNKAHEIGIVSIETECLNVELEKKYALFKAIVKGKMSKGKEIGEFTGHGDATSENITGDFIKPHFIRMAETRAIVRALRWYTNNAGKAAEEEKSEPKKLDKKDG